MRASQTVARLLADAGHEASEEDVVVEVGSGAHGLIWCWPGGRRYGVDPLASFYRREFAFLQEGPVESVEARGEHMPFEDASVRLILSDNVLDHARDPAQILLECQRIVEPHGALYLTFDVHHVVWGVGARLYNALCDAGVRLRVPAFPNHPFHFDERAVDALLERAGWRSVWRDRKSPPRRIRKPHDLVKRVFFKNQRMSVLATPV